jgi:hypothetical protein
MSRIDSQHWKISTGRHFQNGRHKLNITFRKFLKCRIAPLMVTYHYVKLYVSIIIHLEVININVRNFNFPIGFYSNPHPPKFGRLIVFAPFLIIIIILLFLLLSFREPWTCPKVLYCILLLFVRHARSKGNKSNLFTYKSFCKILPFVFILIGRYLCWWTISLRWYNPPSIQKSKEACSAEKWNTVGIILPEAEYGYFGMVNQIVMATVAFL